MLVSDKLPTRVRFKTSLAMNVWQRDDAWSKASLMVRMCCGPWRAALSKLGMYTCGTWRGALSAVCYQQLTGYNKAQSTWDKSRLPPRIQVLPTAQANRRDCHLLTVLRLNEESEVYRQYGAFCIRTYVRSCPDAAPAQAGRVS
jgi:hypothetical protein